MPHLTRSELGPAVRAGILSAGQADRLAEFLGAAPASEQPRFSFVHVLYYLSGMIAIGAMSLIGPAIIWPRDFWQRREAQWSARLRRYLPAALRELVESGT